jgi:cytochrome c556
LFILRRDLAPHYRKGRTMKKQPITLALAVVLITPFLLVSCGMGGGAAEDDSPEGQAVAYRQGLMTAIAWQVGRLRGMASGDIPVDQAAFTKGANDVAALAGMITEGFIPNSIKPNSAALPDIWKNFDDFKMKAADLQMAAKALADASAQNGFEQAKGMVQAVGQACGGCHRPYRKREAQ